MTTLALSAVIPLLWVEAALASGMRFSSLGEFLRRELGAVTINNGQLALRGNVPPAPEDSVLRNSTRGESRFTNIEERHPLEDRSIAFVREIDGIRLFSA